MHRLAHAGLVEQRFDLLLGLLAQLCRPGVLLPGSDGQLGCWRNHGCDQFLFHLRHRFSLGHAAFDVVAAGRVDPDLPDAALAQAFEVVRVAEQELGAPEGVLHPRSAQLVDVHAQSQLIGADSLDHGNGCGTVRSRGRMKYGRPHGGAGGDLRRVLLTKSVDRLDLSSLEAAQGEDGCKYR